MNKKSVNQLSLTLILFIILLVFFTIPMESLSIYKMDEPVGQLGDDTVTRGDVYTTLKLLTLTSSLAVLTLLIQGILVFRIHKKV